MLTYKQYQENHEGKMTPLLNNVISKSISNLNEQDRQLLFPGMADDMEKEFQQTKKGQEIQRIFKDIQDSVAKEIDKLINNLKDHLHTVVHPASVAYGQSFDSGIGVDGRLRQAMKSTYKDMGQPVIGSSSGRRPAAIRTPTSARHHTENYQITLKQYNEFKRTLDSLDEIFLIEVGPVDWAKSKIGSGLDKIAPGVKDKLKGWWQNVWHGSRNPLNPQNLQKWDVALDDILDTFSTQLKGRVKGIINQQFDPGKGVISKHIQNLAKPYHKDTGASSAKPAQTPSEAPEAPLEPSSKDSEEEAPKAPEGPPSRGIGTEKIGSRSRLTSILTPKGRLSKWFKDNILGEFRTDEGIDSEGLKEKLEKDGYDSNVIEKVIELAGKKPKSKPETKWNIRDLLGEPEEEPENKPEEEPENKPEEEPENKPEEEPKLKAPTISADKSQNAVDRVMKAIPEGSFEEKDVKEYLDGGMSEKDIIDWGTKLGNSDDLSFEGYIPVNKNIIPVDKNIKSLEEYLREAESKVSEQAGGHRAGFDSASTPTPKPINDDQAVKKLLGMMDQNGGIEWRHMTFTDLDTGDKFENPEEIMDEDLNKWANDVIKDWKNTKKIKSLSEKDVENMAYFHLDDMGFTVPRGHDTGDQIDWLSKRTKEKTLDQISKIQ